MFQKFDLGRLNRRVNEELFGDWVGPPPLSSLLIVHLILGIGLIVGVTYLIVTAVYYMMQSIRRACSSFRIRRQRKKGRDLEEGTKEVPTPEVLEQRRQEMLQVLQRECENLEEQLLCEKSHTLTTRASDSDLEYLGFEADTPPLKRNSISLQDIPQSVIKIRREKQLRQLKEEIEHLHALSMSEDMDKEPLVPKSPLLKDLQFRYSSSSPSGSPSPVESTEPLSQRIAHLKAQRKLQEIRADLEGLALHLVHAEDIKAKTSSLQDIPKTALGLKRQEGLFSLAKEVEHVKSYKLHQKDILSSVFPETHKAKDEMLAKLNSSNAPKKVTSTTPLLKKGQSMESQGSEVEMTTGSCSALAPTSSLKRTRQHELNRVRVELKELSYKLNLNYVFEGKV